MKKLSSKKIVRFSNETHDTHDTVCLVVLCKIWLSIFKLQIVVACRRLDARTGSRLPLSVQHSTSGNNKQSCQAADYFFPSTFEARQLYCPEIITDHFTVMTAVRTATVSTYKLSPTVTSSHNLHEAANVLSRTAVMFPAVDDDPGRGLLRTQARIEVSSAE